MRPLLLLVGILALSASVSIPAVAQEAVLGTISRDGLIRFRHVDELLINQNRKVKLAPESTPRLEPSDAKSLERVETNQAGLLRGDGKGRVFRVNAGGSTDRVIPENQPLKMSIQPATAQIPLIISAVIDKKAKDSAEVPANEFYFYWGGSDPDRMALQFVLSPKNFGNQDEQLRAVAGLAASFRSSAVAGDLQKNLQRQLETARDEYDGGGSYKSLLEAQKLGALARQSFASDPGVSRDASDIDTRVQATLAAERTLLGLAEIEDWSTFLTTYRKIEVNQDSFPNLKALHRRALEEETRERCLRARTLVTRHRDAAALEELAAAASLDPENREIPKYAESTRMQAAADEAKRSQSSRKSLPKDSAEDRLFRKALYDADRAIQDHDYPRAQDSIKEAERENSEAPELLLTRASLAAATDDIVKALPLLDRYDRCVTESADREKGDAVRNRVLYELRGRREAGRLGIETSLAQGDYAGVYKQSTAALKIDPDNPAFLFPAGVSAAVLRRGDEAKTYLSSYLHFSDSLAGDDTARAEARKLMRLVESKPQTESGSGTPNWFSGRKLPADVYYCPKSLAFQPTIESVAGFKFHMNYLWERGRLNAIHADFDDEKGRQDYSQIAARSAKQSGESQAGHFSFVYDRTLPMVRAVYAGAAPKALSVGDVRLIKNDDKSFKLVDAAGNPLVVLADNPWVDLKVVNQLLGPVATIVSGNSFFNPFIWDGVHYFTVTYDGQGRASSAKEWNADNLVRFSWEGERLVEVAAFHARQNDSYYRRTISYAGSNIGSEDYKSDAHGGRIKYVYSKDTLISAKVEDGGVHDGKTWVAHIAGRN